MKIITAGYCKGMKWDIALYLKTSAQGVGKSTFYEMISEYILGMKCCLKSRSEPLVSLNNMNSNTGLICAMKYLIMKQENAYSITF